MREPSLNALQSAAADGWDWLDQADKRLSGKRQAPDEAAEARRNLAAATARLYATPDGVTVLEAMLDATLRKVAFHTQLGLDPGQVALRGAFREGQNAVLMEILRLKAEGEGAPAPKPRE